MIENSRHQAVIDKSEIIEVALISRWCRDTGDWARLVECFHADALVNTSWFSGSPKDFGAQSKKMLDAQGRGKGPRHITGNPLVTLKGDRGVCQYTLILYNQRVLDGYEFDFTTWSTAYDLFERRNGEWRISQRLQVYEKDRMDPHNPGQVPKSYFAQMDLSSYPSAVRYHLYRNVRSGHSASSTLVVKGTPGEEDTYKKVVEWLKGTPSDRKTEGSRGTPNSILDIRDQAVVDKFEIIEVSTISRWCRDSGDWKRMGECFHPDAHVDTSWFTGRAEDFVKQSGKMMAGHHPKDVQRHIMGNPYVKLRGDHGVCEYTIILYQRRIIDGYEFDFTTWSACVDLFEKHGGAWKIAKRTTIYEKDRMDAYNPAEVPDSYYAQLDLSRYPSAIRYHSYRNERSSGRPPSPNLVLKGSPQEATARKEAAEWVAGG